ncbi:hypothetical protein VTJ04DRAFT_3285 [Mycothermus thermophilus]|uniref:uncharacterized protein n=1 Tax=Humicola insolens TaxID=85995 RepID=UPI00374234E9
MWITQSNALIGPRPLISPNFLSPLPESPTLSPPTFTSLPPRFQNSHPGSIISGLFSSDFLTATTPIVADFIPSQPPSQQIVADSRNQFDQSRKQL